MKRLVVDRLGEGMVMCIAYFFSYILSSHIFLFLFVLYLASQSSLQVGRTHSYLNTNSYSFVPHAKVSRST